MKFQAKWFQFHTSGLWTRPNRKGCREKRRWSVYLVWPFTVSQTIAMIPSVSIQDSQTQDGGRMTCCPLEMQQALTLNHLPGLHPAKVSLLRRCQRKLSHPQRRGEEVPSPTIYKTILIAPPIGLKDKLQLRGGNFPGSSPSAPDPEGADWSHQDNTFGKKSGSPPTSPEAHKVEIC